MRVRPPAARRPGLPLPLPGEPVAGRARPGQVRPAGSGRPERWLLPGTEAAGGRCRDSLCTSLRWRIWCAGGPGGPASAVAAAGRGHFLPPTASRDHLPGFWPWSTGRSGGRGPSGCRPGRSGRPWRSRRRYRQAAQPPGRWSQQWRDLQGDDANS